MSSQGMIYRLFTYPVAHQLLVLDQLAQAGFKVMYEVGQQVHTHTHTHWVDECDAIGIPIAPH